MQPGAPGGWGQPQAPQGYGAPPAPQGYQQAPAPGGYGQPMQQAYPQGGGGSRGPSDKGFFGGLFDFSFSTFVTTKIVKVIYGLQILAAALMVLACFGAGVMQFVERYGSAIMGILFIIMSPVVGFIVLVASRVYMEIVIVMFRIAENLTEINRKTKEPG